MTQSTIPEFLYQATQSLAESLIASEPFLRYEHARHQLEADAGAQSLLKRLSDSQAKLRHKQTHNEVKQSDIDDLRLTQGQVQINATISTYAESQQVAVQALREVNQEISQLIGMDFATLARSNSC